MIAKFGAALLTASAVASAIEFVPAPNHPLVRRDESLDTQLLPVQYASNVVKRAGNPFQPDHELDMEYADMDSYNDPQRDTFGATVHIATKNPAVQTEQFGNAVTEIQCNNGNSMVLTFGSPDLAEQAKSVWTYPEMTIITRTAGCNDDGERVPWSISDAKYEGNKVTFAAKKMNWDAASDKMSVDFGSRGSITNPDAPAPAASSGAPLSKRDDKANLGFSLDNFQLLTSPGGGISTMCKKCKGTGTAVIKTGSFDIKNVASAVADPVKSAVIDPVKTAVVDPIKDTGKDIIDGIGGLFGRDVEEVEKRDIFGSIAKSFTNAKLELDLQNFGASFDFETKANKFLTYSYHVLGTEGQGLPGLSIRDIMSIGPNIDPILMASLHLAEPITMNYGFEFQFADGAGMEIDFINPKDSKLNKLKDTKFKAHPFKMNTEAIHKGIGYDLSFRPVFSFGIKLLGNDLDPIAVTLDAPKWGGTVDLPKNVGPGCKGKGDIDALNVNAAFSFDVGIGANMNVMDVLNFAPSTMLWSTTGVAPYSTCITIGGGKGSPATATATKKKASKTAAASEKTGGASSKPAKATATPTAAADADEDATPASAVSKQTKTKATPAPASEDADAEADTPKKATTTPPPSARMVKARRAEFGF